MRTRTAVMLFLVATVLVVASFVGTGHAAPFSSSVCQSFSDLRQTWYTQLVETVRSLGILVGFPGCVMKADAPATRGQLAAVAARLVNYTNQTVAQATGRQVSGTATVQAVSATQVQPTPTPTPGAQAVVPLAQQPNWWDTTFLGFPLWLWLWLLLLLLALFLLWYFHLRLPRIWNRVHGLRAGEEFGQAEAHARILPGLDAHITKEVSNMSRQRPGRRRYLPWVYARRGNTLKWRIGWHNDEWTPVPAAEVQFRDLLGPGQTYIAGSAWLSIGRGELIPVPGELIVNGQVFSLADIPGAPVELPAQSTAFLYFKTRINFNGNAGQPAEGNQQAQGHHGHDPDAGE